MVGDAGVVNLVPEGSSGMYTSETRQLRAQMSQRTFPPQGIRLSSPANIYGKIVKILAHTLSS